MVHALKQSAAAGFAAFLLVVLGGCRPSSPTAAVKLRPNFIIILYDDLGYGDTAPFGNRIHRTPNLDRMAAEGIKLTSFYVTSGLCTPSRSSLLTASYPRRVGMHANAKGYFVLVPGDQSGLNPAEVTLAELLK